MCLYVFVIAYEQQTTQEQMKENAIFKYKHQILCIKFKLSLYLPNKILD